MKKIWKITQYILFIVTAIITIIVIYLNKDIGLTIRGILLTLFFGSLILEDKLGKRGKISETTFDIVRTLSIVFVLLIDFKY